MTVGSRSGGSGSKDSRSNLDRWFQIGRPGFVRGRKRRRSVAGGEPCGRTSPEFAVLGALGVDSTRTQVWEAQEGTCDAPRASTRRGKVRSSVHGCRGGLVAAVLPASTHSRGTELSSVWYGFGAHARSSTEPTQSLRGLPGKAVTLRHGGAALYAAAVSQGRRLGPCARYGLC